MDRLSSVVYQVYSIIEDIIGEVSEVCDDDITHVNEHCLGSLTITTTTSSSSSLTSDTQLIMLSSELLNQGVSTRQ